MMIEQGAGRCKIVTFTDGFPLCPEITIKANGGDVTARVRIEDLHDLRYCIDRMLAQVDAEIAR